mmetsp:Transcript_77/g.89  ORF Transcript_77/g.89 Transcript_77/m.89 type:complete len:85 (+) Transcript_77:156-410(+)|eukprot:CAMPEP_0116068470 /NCGR_PEP_ID=MMETSP0322-20121206/11677_1 /TAXON_ID=163516 /ORGANISM="Leptocylindrus danicus var. apora, Strain B651" /LENGTH=84 /DNA_ID=CAMNT_0003555581 /DNA_START=172 /DNA_END=426 /DNA_ORIENTATION=+
MSFSARLAAGVLVLLVGLYVGLKLARAFALSIAQENHDAITAADKAAEELRIRRVKEADAAVSAARSKVLELEMEEEKPGVEPV